MRGAWGVAGAGLGRLRYRARAHWCVCAVTVPCHTQDARRRMDGRWAGQGWLPRWPFGTGTGAGSGGGVLRIEAYVESADGGSADELELERASGGAGGERAHVRLYLQTKQGNGNAILQANTILHGEGVYENM